MVALTAASKQRSNLGAACRAAGFAPQIVAETSDLFDQFSLFDLFL